LDFVLGLVPKYVRDIHIATIGSGLVVRHPLPVTSKRAIEFLSQQGALAAEMKKFCQLV